MTGPKLHGFRRCVSRQIRSITNVDFETLNLLTVYKKSNEKKIFLNIANVLWIFFYIDHRATADNIKCNSTPARTHSKSGLKS